MAPEPTRDEASRGKRLDGWKQIATHLGTSTKTAMRWETQEAMPVHRHEHAERSSVFAFDSELDTWLAQRRPESSQPRDGQVRPSMADTSGMEIPAELSGGVAAALDRYLNARHSDGDQRILQYALLAGVLKPQATLDGRPGPGAERITTQIVRAEQFQRIFNELLETPAGCPPPLSRTIFLGRESALHQIRDSLVVHTSAPDPIRQVIVTGVPGVGKTTLAAVLSRDPEIIRAYPDGVLWTCLDKAPVLIAVIAAWGRALGATDLLRFATVDEAAAALRHRLQDKRMLLMVDDVWEEGHGAVFQNMVTGECGLIFTTRLPRVAEAPSQTGQDIHIIRQLEQSDALRLISLLAPAVVRQFPEECGELLRDLECLPLAIHVAARLLRKRLARGLDVGALLAGIRHGSAVINAKAPSDRAVEGMIPTVQALLHKSTDMLDGQTRRCFVDLGAFAPKPASFDLEAMKQVCDLPDATPLAEELIDYGLLEPTGDGRFQMHALLVAHAHSLAVGGWDASGDNPT